jgi:hypothetical protein
MMDQYAMQGLLKEMENAAELVLQQDAAFFEALQALKWEIDGDPRVKSAVRDLRAAGQNVFSSFVPRIKVRIKTQTGLHEATKPAGTAGPSAVDPIARQTLELKNAASAVIMASRYCQELERIVNEAVSASESFENMASRVERAGYEVVISLDLSAYVQVQASSAVAVRSHGTALQKISSQNSSSSGELADIKLSSYDLNFLKALKIKTDENLSG